VSAYLSGTSVNPGAITLTIQGARSIPVTVSSARMMERSVKAIPANSTACFFDLLRYPVKTGIKAMVREPSANRRRKRFGILKATKKASVAGPAPKNPAITISRIKPNTLLNRVASPTTHAAFTTRVFSVSFCGIKFLALLIFPPCTHQ